MATRQYEFINGPTTSELPSYSTPTGTTDLVSKGYADENYMQGGSYKTTITALKGVSAANRKEGDIRYADDKQWFYKFSASATGANDDDLILQPTSGTGRWIKVLQNLTSNFVGQTDTQNVTNKTVSGSVIMTDVYFKSATGTNRKVRMSASGSSDNTQTTLTFLQTADRAITFQDSDHVLMGRDTTDTMTNKTADAMVIKENSFFQSSTGTARRVGVSASGSTNSTQTTFFFSQTANRSVTVQDADHVLVGRDTTDTLTNKTFTAPVIGNYSLYTESSSPSTPASGKLAVFAKSDHKLYTKDSNGTETQVGSGSGGSVNYIGTSDFEGNAVTGWSTYADAAATTPVDGTGGSPNSTFAATNSSPLRGSYSAIFTKGAANRQGEGFSYDFTIASADKSRPLAISWEGSASANYTGSSGTEYMSVFIYDVTNATLIYPSSTTVSQGVSKGYCTFLASTSTSYRLIFHVAGTGTSSWTYTIDSVSVGPQLTVQGFSGSDWQSYTATFTNFTVSSQDLYWRRVGSNMEIRGEFTIATEASAEARLSIPNSLTVGSTPGSNTQVVGYVDQANANSTNMARVLATSGNAYLNFGAFDVVTAVNPLNNANSTSCFNAVRTSIHASFPISTWQANVTMADRAIEEFASNNGPTWDATNTSDFTVNTNSNTGSAIGGTLTAFRTKVVRFANPVQSTDTIEVQFSDDQKTWSRVGAFQHSALGVPPLDGYFEGTATSSTAGVTWSRLSTTTDIQVNFFRYMWMRGDGSGQTNWNSSYYWRVRKISGGGSVGYPVSTSNVVVNHNSTPYTDVVKSGTYTPTVSSTTNITVSTAQALNWLQVGRVVTVSGRIENVNPGSGTATFRIDCPVVRTSNFANNSEGGGVAIDSGTSTPLTVYRISNVVGAKTMEIQTINSGDPAAQDIMVHFTYNLG